MKESVEVILSDRVLRDKVQQVLIEKPVALEPLELAARQAARPTR